ncbi:MAG: hypothetical protein NVSMB10_01050 [Steroidobacteraceae bacterium]
MRSDLHSATGVRQPRPCTGCGSFERTSLYRNELACIAGLDLSYDVVQCSMCTTAFGDLLAAPADYAAYYENCSKYDNLGSVHDISPVDRRRARLAAAFVADNCQHNDSVLDIGCGSGVLLAEFKRHGWHRMKGIDPAPNAGDSARQLFGLEDVHRGDMSRIGQSVDLGEFDLICLMAVLEHLPDPLAALTAIARDMRPDAALLIEVPAVESFAHAPFEPYGELSIEHINFFSAHSLAELTVRAGFRTVASTVLTSAPAASDSLCVLLQKGSSAPADSRRPALMGPYLSASAIRQRDVLDRIARLLDTGPALIWGAGSHSARLLPMLRRLGIDGGIRGIIDSNPNLTGRRFGTIEVMPPARMQEWPDTPVIVSSFRASALIAAAVRSTYPNSVLELYARFTPAREDV